MREVVIGPGFESWQVAARRLVRDAVPPVDVVFRKGARDVSSPGIREPEPQDAGIRVPRRFVDLARGVAPHRDPSRWDLLYAVLWRLVHDNRELLESGDPDVARLLAMEAAVGEGREVIGAGPFVPSLPGATLGDCAAAAARCTGCDLYRHASRTVFGKGPADARVVMVGEQPGDQEDRQGAPFLGPAGDGSPDTFVGGPAPMCGEPRGRTSSGRIGLCVRW